MGMLEVYEEWFGGEGFYPHESDSEECSNWQEYNARLGGVEVTVQDVRRAQAWERSKNSKVYHVLSDPKARRILASTGYYQRWYTCLLRELRKQA